MNNSKVDWEFLFIDSRARVYLLWAFLATIGFMATHYFQRKQINGVWAVISVVGMYYMYRVMPLRVKQMKNIFYVWLIFILIGMAISGVVFYLNNELAGYIIARLGAVWLFIMAAAYAANGLVDRPAKWYFFAAGLNAVLGLLLLLNEALLPGQYLIAAVASFWSMMYLWLYRADYY